MTKDKMTVYEKLWKYISDKIKIETLSSIEKGILSARLQIKKLKDNRLNRDICNGNLVSFLDGYNVQKMVDDVRENELESILEQLETKRQHKLDRRNGWRSKFVWSVVAPIIVTVMTTYFLVSFGLIK